ncbi:MAG TPA: hypothetical protein VJM46_02385 [Candidatus Saccharimonadales bacterium]|nr:hypothetical protein [Candidatus Saccharimonadales bacterium]
MAKAKIIVRPKRSALPRLQVWSVLREDPETREVEEFIVECAEGHFFRHYRNLGLIDGNTQFDPYQDMDEGRMERELIATHR